MFRQRWGVLAVIALVGCVSPGTDFDGLPFYRRDRTLVGTARNGERIPVRETLSPITLGRSIATEDEQKVRLTWPYPLLSYRRQGDNNQLQFFTALPFVVPGRPLRIALGIPTRSRELPFGGYNVEDYNEEGQEDQDFGFMPLFAAGHDEKTDESYFAMFPFGGKTKGLIGKDDALWVGFPYPLYLWWTDNQWHSHHILPPFINWTYGEGHSGFRFWPFFGHYERVDEWGNQVYDRTWLLWPLITWQTNGMNLKRYDDDGNEVAVEPTNVFAFLPFYGHVHGPEVDETDILYPFFRWTRWREKNEWELRAPFPFVILGGNDEGESRYDFWPFFGIRQRPGYIRHFVLAPFERYELRDDEWVYDKQINVLPFFRYQNHKNRKNSKTGRDFFKIQIWPFFHYSEDDYGTTDFRTLSIFPFWEETIEEIFLPFVTLYRHREMPEIGSSETNLLLGLLSWRSIEKTGEDDYFRLSMLFGLFQYRRKGPEKALRFFYFAEWPVWRTDE